ncbi:glucocorticoid receptor-like isoform X2 [Polyodon spathula]|uniref:glucocorticoid receptor-like isoform X2 n=1 Tax=Polyodon spathula TaxID=7913 RepID=UPI001B7DF020|nr:glucocorticoid receptor-like isoform X2 [Polyodon spathula]
MDERAQRFNGDESLKLAGFCDRGDTAFRSGVSTMSTSTESTVAQASASLHTVASDISNGVGSHAPQRELMTAVSASMGLYMEDTDSKVMGSNLGIQQPRTPGSLTLGETNFTLLEESIADLNRSSGGIDSLSAGSDPFSLKSEEYLPMDKSVLALDQDSFAQVGKDSSVSPGFFNDDQNTLDLLQEYDLPVSPKGEMNESPWNLNAFYGEDDDSLLSPLTTEDPFLADITKDTKPTIINNSILITNNRNSGDQQLLNPPVPTIKLEKERFIELSTPGVIKQENASKSYCQMSGSSSDMSSPLTVPISICGVSTSGRQTYHYGVSTSQDQKPVFNMYPPLPTVVDGWNRSQGFGEASVTQTGNETFSIQGLPTPNYLSSMSRQDAGSSPATSTKSTHKTCLVCSDEASGCHYGVLTCGSCKVFFKRAVEGQHNYLCAGRNDCIIDKIRRKNCPACRFRKCLQAGMNLEARKTKKLNKLKGIQTTIEQATQLPKEQAQALVPKSMPQLTPTMLSLLEAIEPEVVYSGYDSTIPDTSTRLMSTLNRLGGRQVVAAVKWAKALPGFRSLHLDDQMTLLQCSWLFLMSFSLGWRSYKQSSGSMLCFAPDLVINDERMKLPFIFEQCEQMLKISNELVRLELSYEEYLCMKVLLLLSSVPKEGLKSQGVFDEIRMTYIKELGKAIVKREENSSQNWQRFYQLTKLLDSMHELVGGLLNFCFYTFVNKSLSVEFPEMLAEMISNQLPKFKAGRVKSLLFHQK